MALSYKNKNLSVRKPRKGFDFTIIFFLWSWHLTLKSINCQSWNLYQHKKNAVQIHQIGLNWAKTYFISLCLDYIGVNWPSLSHENSKKHKRVCYLLWTALQQIHRTLYHLFLSQGPSSLHLSHPLPLPFFLIKIISTYQESCVKKLWIQPPNT